MSSVEPDGRLAILHRNAFDIGALGNRMCARSAIFEVERLATRDSAPSAPTISRDLSEKSISRRRAHRRESTIFAPDPARSVSRHILWPRPLGPLQKMVVENMARHDKAMRRQPMLGLVVRDGAAKAEAGNQ